MSAQWNGWILFFVVVASQGLLIGTLIVYLKPRYRWTGIASILFSVLLWYYVFFWTGALNALPQWTGILMGIPYLMAMCISMQSERIPQRYVYALLTPFWLYVSFFLLSLMKPMPGAAHAVQAAFQCLVIICFGLVAFFSYNDRTYRTITLMFLGFALSHTAYYVLYWTNVLTRQQDYAVSICGAIFIYGSAYYVFAKKSSQRIPPDELHEKMRNMLIERIEEGKLYLDNELRLSSLADATGFSVHQISELINSGGEKFADLINKYRVNEAKRILTSPEGDALSTEEIGYAAGFNNKTSFYHHFKKSTGLSPMKFRMKNRSWIANN